MLYITLVERIVDRCSDTKSRDYMKVTNMTKRIIDTYSPYNSATIPRIGEVIQLDKNKSYDVVQVIHSKRFYDSHWHDEVFLEVKPHVPVHSYNSGSYSFQEDWPLITDLEDTPTNEE